MTTTPRSLATTSTTDADVTTDNRTPTINNHTHQFQEWLKTIRTIILREGDHNSTVSKCTEWLLFTTTGDMGWTPQCSGLSLMGLPHLFRQIRPASVQRVMAIPSVKLSNISLTASTFLLWNYVMQQNKRGRWYSFLYAIDYAMIGTAAVINTFPLHLHSARHWALVVTGFGGAMMAHVMGGMRGEDGDIIDGVQPNDACGYIGADAPHCSYSENTLHSFRGHHYALLLSTLMGMYRSVLTGRWTPTLIRLYSTVVCAVIFYTTIHRVQQLEDYRALTWWLPWVWHMHAGVCQQTSLEMVV